MTTTYNDVNILGSVVTNPIIIVNYDQSWPKLYHLFSKRFADSLGDIAAAIEHIGSTAVPGLAAKPVIDIDVLLATSELLPTAIERLGRIGYSYQGNLGIADRIRGKTHRPRTF